TCIDILLADNSDYLQNIITTIEGYINANDTSVEGLYKLDRSLNFLFSELIHKGFSKGFLYKLFYAVFVNTLTNAKTFEEHFTGFKDRILGEKTNYKVVFRIDTTQKVYDAISEITSITNFALQDNIDDIRNIVRENREMP